MQSSENIRYFVAGRIACAQALARAGNDGAAAFILKIVRAYYDLPNVSAPPAYVELTEQCIANPAASLEIMAMLEEWFCNPFNTVIEKSGAKFQ